MKSAIRAILALLLLGAVLIGCGGSSHHYVYTVGKSAEDIFAFQETSSGQLNGISGSPFATGGLPIAVAVTPAKTFAFVVSAGAGGIVGYTFNSKNGSLALANAAVNTGTNPVSVAIDPSGQHVYVLSQGSGTAQSPPTISAFSIDSFTGVLTALSGSPFATLSNPVSMAMPASGGALYVVSATQGVAGIPINSDGTLGTAQTPLPAGTSPSFVTADPGNHLVYVADSKGNAVFGFTVSGSSLTAIGASTAVGTAPAALAVDPDSKLLFVANSGSNNVSVFSIGSRGALSPAQGSPFSTGTGPAFVITDGSSHLFVADQGSGDIGEFSFSSSGSLSPVSGSPFTVPTSPSWIAVVD